MKAFLIGLGFLAGIGVLAGFWFLFFPLLVFTGLLLRFIFIVLFAIFAIWLLGKIILYVWGKLKTR